MRGHHARGKMPIPGVDRGHEPVRRTADLVAIEQVIGQRQGISALRVTADRAVRMDEFLLKRGADSLEQSLVAGGISSLCPRPAP